MIPFSPRLTLRPNSFHERMPATFVAVGRWLAITKNVLKTVVVKLRHGREAGGECLTVSGFQSLHQCVNAGLNEFLIVFGSARILQ